MTERYIFPTAWGSFLMPVIIGSEFGGFSRDRLKFNQYMGRLVVQKSSSRSTSVQPACWVFSYQLVLPGIACSTDQYSDRGEVSLPSEQNNSVEMIPHTSSVWICESSHFCVQLAGWTKKNDSCMASLSISDAWQLTRRIDMFSF